MRGVERRAATHSEPVGRRGIRASPAVGLGPTHRRAERLLVNAQILRQMRDRSAGLRRVRFLVAGSGTHEAELRRQARRRGLMPHATFLGWLADDGLRERLVAEASAHVLRFDWADVAERTAEVYGELAGGAAGAAARRRA